MSGIQIRVCNCKLFFLISQPKLFYICGGPSKELGTQKNCLNEMVLLSIKNFSMLKLMGKKIFIVLLSKMLFLFTHMYTQLNVMATPVELTHFPG